jgi:hypothetical protein
MNPLGIVTNQDEISTISNANGEVNPIEQTSIHAQLIAT